MFDKKQAASDYRQAILNGMAINQQTSEQIANIQNGYQNYQSMVALGASTLGKVSDVEEEQIAEAQEIARNSFMGNPNLETSQQRRRRDLQQRTSRIAERLSGVTAQRDSIHADDLKLKGISDEEIQAAQTTQDRLRDTDQTSDLERAENAIKLYLGSDEEKQNAIYDRDIEYFVKNDAQVTEMHFGKDSAMYKAIQAIKEYNNRNLNSETSVNTSDNSVLNFSNLVATSASGLSELVGGFSSIYHRTTKDGKEREEAINNEDSWANQLQRFSDKIATAELNASKQRVSLIQSRAKEEGDRAKELALKQGISKVQADKIARDITSEINDGLYKVPMSISSEVAEFLPDLVTTAVTMGTASVASASIKTALNSIAKAFGKGASKAEAKLAGEKAMKEFATAELKAGRTITAEQAKQAQKEGTKAYFQAQRAQASKLDSKIVNAVGITEEAIETGSQNAVQGYQQASEAIKSMKIEDLKASKRGQEILKENPEISDEDLKLQLADEAGVLAYDMTFGGTAAMGILSGKVQTKAINAWKNLGSTKGGLGALGTSILQEFFGEGFEEGWTKFSSNFAESKLNQNKDLFEGVYDNAKYGAITGAASTSISNAPELIKLSAGSGTAVKSILESQVEKGNKKVQQKEQEEINTILGSPDTDNSENKTGVLGKKFSETNFGKTWNTIKSENETVKEIISKSGDNYTNVVKELRNKQDSLAKEFQEAVNQKDETKIKQLDAEYVSIQSTLDNLRKGLEQDVLSANPKIQSKLNQINNLIQKGGDEESINKLMDEIDTIQSNDKQLTKLTESTLYKLLTDDSYRVDNNEKITTEDILGNPNYSAPQYGSFIKDSNKKLSSMEDLVAKKGNKAISEVQANLAKIFSEFSAMNQKGNIKPNEVLRDAAKLLNRAELLLAKSDNPKLKQVVSSFRKALEASSKTKHNNIPVFKEIYFGSMKNGKYSFGLMDYFVDSLRNNGNMSLKMRSNLVKFQLSQLGKVQGLDKVIKHFGSSKDPIDLHNVSLRSNSKLTQSLSGNKTSFDNIDKARNYKKAVLNDLNIFTEITNALLSTGSDTVIDPDIPTKIKLSKNFKVSDKKDLLNLVPNTQEEYDSVRDTIVEDWMELTGANKKLAEKFIDTRFRDNAKKANPTSNNHKLNIWYSSKENRHLSNLALRPFEYTYTDGNTYKFKSVEHAYQTLKSGKFDKDTYENSGWSKEGTKVKGKFKADKNTNRDLMKSLIKESFLQNSKYKEALIKTGSTEFTHNQDKGYWKEEFPKILSEVREELKNTPTKDTTDTSNTEDTSSKSVEVIPEVSDGLGTFADSSMPLRTRIEVSNPYIGNVVAQAFEQFSKWGQDNIGNDLTEFDSEDTNTDFEVNTTDGMKTYSIPMSAMVELHRKGFDPTVNLVDKITTDRELDKVSQNFLDILNQDGKELNDSLGINNEDYSRSFKENLKQVNQFFNKNIPVVLNNSYKGKLSKFTLANAMLNFISIEEGSNDKPKVVVPNEVKVAFAKAISYVQSDSHSLSFGRHSQFVDYFYEDLQATNVEVFKATDVEKYGEGFESRNLGVDKAKKEPTDLANYSELGVTRNNFIELLGQQVLDNMPFNINKGSSYYSEDIHNGLIQSLGMEAYNIMLSQGLLEVHYVDVTQGTGKDVNVHTIPYVNFKSNISDNLTEKEQLAFESVSSGVDLDGMSVEQAKSYLAKHNKNLLNQAELVRNKSDEIDEVLYSQESKRNSGVFISSLSGRVGKKYKNRTNTVDSSDTKNDITPTNNEELVKAVGSKNTVTYALNREYYGLLKTNPEALQLAFGYTLDIDSLPVTESTKKSLRSRNNDILRAIGLLKRFVSEAEAKGLSEEDIAFNFRHHFVSNMRTMLKADMNPQSNKIVREMLRLVQTEVDADDGKIIGEMKLDVDLGTKKSKFPIEGSQRSIEQLIKVAKGRRKSKDKNFAVGFLLALAQGLDLGKIEKTKNTDVFTLVQDWFNDTEDNFRRDAMEIVWKMQLGNEQGTPYTLSKEEMDTMARFGKEMGTAAPRALYALQSLANFLYRGTENDPLRTKRNRMKFSTNLLLEADGIGNGLFNITKQFTLDFTVEYFNTIKRTGVIPLDILSQKYFQSKKKLKGDKLVEELQGSAGMFTKDSPDSKGLRDIYEVIADKLSKEANEAVRRILNSEYAQGKSSLSFEDFKKKLPEDHPNKQLVDDIRLLSQLSLTGHIKLSEDVKLEDIVFSPNDVAISEDFLIEVKRNLSKAGVTPTVYGGQLEGIANQLTGDIKGQYIKTSDKLIELASKLDTLEPKSQEYKDTLNKLQIGLNTLSNFNLVLGIPSSSLNQIDLNDKGSKLEIVKSALDKNIFSYGINSKNVKNSLKSGLARALQSSIQETYVGAFSMLNYSMAHDDIGFHNFITEFQDKVKSKIEERNKDKGYSKNDPRNHSPLSKKEIREVIKTITSAPIIATAYANNAELFEDVWELGNSLVKRGRYSLDEQTTLNSSYVSVQQGNYQRNLTTQMFRTYQKYEAAGASNATSTTPSTESATQSGLAQELLEMLSGITSLDVFDGIDALLYFRDLLGQIANKITNRVHQDTNLIKHFYNRFVKSGFINIPNTHRELSPKFKKAVNEKDLFALLTMKHTNLNQKDLGYLLGVLTLVQMKLENAKLEPDYLSPNNVKNKELILDSIKQINAYKSKITELRDGLLYNPSTTKNELELPTPTNELVNSYINNTYSFDAPSVSSVFGYEMNNLAQDFAYKVAQAEALRYIERKFLPSIINQFAGANRGYLFNEQELDNVGKRFYEFALTKFGSNLHNVDFRTDSETLAEFLKQDSIIQEEYNKFLNNQLNKIDVPSVESHWISPNNNESMESFEKRIDKSALQNSNTADSEILTIEEFSDKYDYLADNTLAGKVFKTLTHNIKELFGDNFRISYDADKIGEFLLSKGVSQQSVDRVKADMNNSGFNGFKQTFKGSNGEVVAIIAMNPRKKLTGKVLQNILNHEMLHVNFHYLAAYMANKSLRDTVNAKSPEAKRLEESAKRIDNIIKSMVQNGKHLSEVQELLKIYNENPSDFYHYQYLVSNKYNQVSVGLANYMFLSQMDEKGLPAGWSLHDFRTSLEGSLHELLAYSLGNSDMLTELSNRKESRDASVWEKIKELFSKARQELLNILGLQSEDLKESNLNGLLEALVNVNTIDTPTAVIINNSILATSNNARRYRENQSKFNELMKSNAQASYVQGHDLHLQNLTDVFQDNIQKVFGNDKGEFAYGEEAVVTSKALADKELNNFIKDLRNKGLVMTSEEERVFKFAYAANVANFESGANADLLRESSKAIQDILVNANFDTIPNDVMKLLSGSKFNHNALMLAIFSTNKQFKDVIDTKISNNSKLSKSLKNIENKLNDWTIFKDVPITGSNRVIDKLQYSAMLFNFRTKQTYQEKDRILRNEMDKADALVKHSEWLDGLLDELPNGLSKYLAISKDALTGKDLFQDGSGADSSIGQLIRQIVRNNEKIHGRNTLMSKGLSWIIGQDFGTQYSAKFKGESQQLTSVIRERLASTIPYSIRKQFSETLSKDQEKSLDNVLIVSELHRIADLTGNGMKPELILKDTSYRQQAISDLWVDIGQELDTMFKGNTRKEVENFLRWQTQGLGELMVTRTAKSNNSNVSHEILPNSKAIAGFAGTKWNIEPSNINPNLSEKVGQLATLYSLEYQNQDDLDVIADIFTNEPEGMNSLVETMKSLDNERNVHGNTVLGEDGYRYNKRNPNQDVKLMHPNSDKSNLLKFGYSHKATLPSGTEVWVTNDNINNRFTTGIFGLSDASVKGVTLDGMNTLGSFTGSHSEARRYHFNKAIKDPNYYNKLKETSSIKQTISADGKNIISEVEELPRNLYNQFIDTYENGIDAIGNAKGRTMEEIATEQNNIYYIDQLNKHYHKSVDKSKFTKIDGNFEPKGKSQADREFANRLNNIFNSLPEPTKAYIEKEGGLYIETTEIDNLLGYHKASITDIWTDKSGLPKPVQKVIQETIGIFSRFTGIKEVVIAKRSERLLSEVVSLGKDFILNRSGVVAFGNLSSNIVHLWNTGIPVTQIPGLMKDGLQHIKQYNHSLNRLAELHHQNDITKDVKAKAKIESEIKILQESLNKSPVKPLVDEGILTSITLENQRDEKEFDYIPQFQRKLGMDRFKETKVGKVWSNVMVQDGSTTHEFMEQALDLGDFVAKYALYTHLTKNRQFKHERAMNVIRDEFVNYSYNRGRVFDFMNQTGLTWFLSYKLGIQKIFFRNLRRNFLRTSAVYAGAKGLGTNQVVPLQNLLLDGSLSYQLDPSNIYKSFSSHWLSLIL